MRAITLLAVSLVALPATLAAHCDTWTTTEPVVYCTSWTLGSYYPEVCPSGDAAGAYYVQQDDCSQACIFSIWVYEESNGIAGLQRADEVVDDTCHGMIVADTIVV